MADRWIVRICGERVGEITRRADGKVTFRFVALDWHNPQRPILGQRFEDLPRDRVYVEKETGRVPRFFANYLPEGQVRAFLLRHHRITPGDELRLLAVLGQDLPGAVEVIPAADLGDAPETIGAQAVALDPEGQGLRFSLAGVQLKLSMVSSGDRFTLPTRGQDGDWLVKLMGSDFPGCVENEYAVMTWARTAGFDVPECRLCPVEDLVGVPEGFRVGEQAFAIRRYDRTATGRVHQEDFAQVTGTRPDQKYDHLTYEKLGLLALALLGSDGLTEFLRRLLFVIATGNADAHLKNWSLYYPQRREAQWAPLYDQLCTVAWPQLAQALALNLAGVKPFVQLTGARMEELRRRIEAGAREGGLEIPGLLGDARQWSAHIQDTLKGFAEARERAQAVAPLPAAHLQGLAAHWRRVPLLAEVGL